MIKKMKISIKSEEQIEKMRISGRLAAEVLEMIEPFVVPGVSTEELDRRCYEHIVNIQNAIPANVGYRGFEKTICSSINQVICHGIPDENRILKEGDIVNIDVTVIKDGWHGDTSKMYLVGKCLPHNKRLVEVTQECLYKAIEVVKPGAYLGDIGHAIQNMLRQITTVLLRTIADTELEMFTMKTLKYSIMVNLVEVFKFKKVWYLPSSP